MLDRKLRRRVERAFYDYTINKERGAEAIVELVERGLTAKYGAVMTWAILPRAKPLKPPREVTPLYGVEWLK